MADARMTYSTLLPKMHTLAHVISVIIIVIIRADPLCGKTRCVCVARDYALSNCIYYEITMYENVNELKFCNTRTH